MAVCCCSLAGTAACNHCSQNPFATEVWTNATVTTDHIEAKPFGNGIDVGKPQTNYDLLISKTPEELAEYLSDIAGWLSEYEGKAHALLKWLKSPVEVYE